MESIEERAKEYAKMICSGLKESDIEGVYEDFLAGAESEHKELTKWNSPDNPPKHTNQILIKVNGGFQIGQYFDEKYVKDLGFCGWIIKGQIASDTSIIGWREIHE